MTVDPAATEGKQKFTLRLVPASGEMHDMFVWGETAVDALAAFFAAVALKQDDLGWAGAGFNAPLRLELIGEPT